jgi:hypothetical protein
MESTTRERALALAKGIEKELREVNLVECATAAALAEMLVEVLDAPGGAR